MRRGTTIGAASSVFVCTKPLALQGLVGEHPKPFDRAAPAGRSTSAARFCCPQQNRCMTKPPDRDSACLRACFLPCASTTAEMPLSARFTLFDTLCHLKRWRHSARSLRELLRFLVRCRRNPMLLRPLLCLHSSRVYHRQRSLRYMAWPASLAACRPFLYPSGGAFVGALVLPAAVSRTTGRTKTLPEWLFCSKDEHRLLPGQTA